LLTRPEPDCGVECETSIRIEPAYLSQFFDDTDADFESGDYEYLDEDPLAEGVREVVLQLDSAGVTGQ
jgi:hypothetical protein